MNAREELNGVFTCPACGTGLTSLFCKKCGKVFPSKGAIPLLFHPTEESADDTTDTVKAFYEEAPFPNYDDMDSRETLASKANRGLFARLLNEQIPHGARILEVGCGTGQLSNFLGMAPFRKVYGSDICLNSLSLAEGFRSRFSIENAQFIQMNLFRPAFPPNFFDVVISNGVLHHTADPAGAFRSIATRVKPGGFILIGLYNKIGRLLTDLRRWMFRVTGDRLLWLDGHIRQDYNRGRKLAWFRDQYKHPCEHKHTYSEVLDWLETAEFDFVSSIPKICGEFGEHEQLFSVQRAGTGLDRVLTELEMLISGGQDGALFIVIGRKRL